jgi:small-conductance mechanosensitive channel
MERDGLLKGKKVAIYFDDGSRIGKKDGTVIEISENSIVFKSISGKTEIIPFSRIIRIEETFPHGGN